MERFCIIVQEEFAMMKLTDSFEVSLISLLSWKWPVAAVDGDDMSQGGHPVQLERIIRAYTASTMG